MALRNRPTIALGIERKFAGSFEAVDIMSLLREKASVMEAPACQAEEQNNPRLYRTCVLTMRRAYRRRYGYRRRLYYATRRSCSLYVKCSNGLTGKRTY
jgi:hypothetical protein